MNGDGEIASERDAPTRVQILIYTSLVALMLAAILQAVQAARKAEARIQVERTNLELYREIDSLRAERDNIQAERDMIRLDVKAAAARLEVLRAARVKGR